MNTFTFIFLGVLALAYTVQIWLLGRQTQHVSAHRDTVPGEFKGAIDIDVHRKAADYTVAKIRVVKTRTTVDTLLLLFFTLGGGITLIASFWSDLEVSSVIRGTCLMITIFFIDYLVGLPLDIYQTFSIEEDFGFNRTSVKRYFVDQSLEIGLALMIGAPLLILILWVMTNLGSLWWLLAWIILIGASIMFTWAYPKFIAPLFNKFTLLDNQELKHRIESLLKRCGFSSNGIFVMDGSTRSGHGNAYFTGFGTNKRIVFFDTLIDSLNPAEIEAVLAHELGHFKHKHVIKMLFASAALSFIGFAILGWLAQQNWFYLGLGVERISNAAALLLFVLVSPAFTLFLQPIKTYFQRKQEFEADDFAS
ncbi:M48 family metallopeptidase, partial [bacterium]|nr:M48 family metallopeptidase [bacterium]